MGTERRNPWETRHWHKQKPQTQLVLGSARAAAQRGFTRAGATAPPELETQHPPMPYSTRQRLQGTRKGSNPRAGAHHGMGFLQEPLFPLWVHSPTQHPCHVLIFGSCWLGWRSSRGVQGAQLHLLGWEALQKCLSALKTADD